MSGVSVCTCGAGGVCDRKCAGAVMQQQECERRGHLTEATIHNAPGAGGYCYRCGEDEREVSNVGAGD